MATANALATVGNTVGITQLGLNFSNGLVVSPGTGQAMCVTYSMS
jgi:hypothetical protein